MMENPYITVPRVRAALRALDVHPTRGMGQNFLIDPDALAAIVAGAALSTADRVVEVGPGLGVLTWELLQRAGQVTAVELDARLAARLRQEFADEPKLALIQSDILKCTPEQILHSAEAAEPQTADYKVVANLPYAITSAVLRHFLEAQHKPTLMVVLVQWEVAVRIVAQPGNLSVLAHSVQIYAEPEILARVPASGFLPAPAVDSAVLRLRVRPQPAVDVDITALMRLIKSGFLQARKKLSNALPTGLAAMGTPIDKIHAVAALAAAGIDPNRRAETVTLDEWVRLYHQLATFNPSA